MGISFHWYPSAFNNVRYSLLSDAIPFYSKKIFEPIPDSIVCSCDISWNVHWIFRRADTGKFYFTEDTSTLKTLLSMELVQFLGF
jgi:hypothetical protein